MARLWSSGAEQNSSASNGEFSDSGGTVGSGSRSLVTSPVRSGTYALRHNPSAANARTNRVFTTADSSDAFYFRAYVRVATYPSTQVRLMYVASTAAQLVAIRMNTDGTLELWNQEDSAQVGSDSSVLTLNTWYRIEMKVDCTTLATTSVAARIDGTDFASGTINLAAGCRTFVLGDATTASYTADIFYDDMAINDDSGASQNSYPGSGKIIHLLPNAAGDSTQWAVGAGAGANYVQVSEVAPDDSTTFLQSTTLNHEDLFNVSASGIGASDNVALVQVGVRSSNVGAGTNPSFVVEAEKTSGGTKAQGSAITPSTTTWSHNTWTTPSNYTLTLYQDPDGAAWTQSTLDSMQIGMKVTVDGDDTIRVTSIWALVEYTVAAAASPTITGLSSVTGLSTITL